MCYCDCIVRAKLWLCDLVLVRGVIFYSLSVFIFVCLFILPDKTKREKETRRIYSGWLALFYSFSTVKLNWYL